MQRANPVHHGSEDTLHQIRLEAIRDHATVDQTLIKKNGSVQISRYISALLMP